MEIIKNEMFNKVYEVDCFSNEFAKMTKEKFSLKPPYPKYSKWLIQSLTILEEQQKNALRLSGFEPLKNVNPKLYSIRYPRSPLNPRVLYVYLDEGIILLLAAFKEKKKSDYTHNIEFAQKRLQLLNK